MTVQSVKAGADPNLIKLGLSDGSLFYISLSYLDVSFHDTLSPASVLDTAALEAVHYAGACYRAERAALNLIARTEQFYRSLLLKLQQRGHERQICLVVLERLCSLDLVNDKRYIEYWLEARIRRGTQGPLKLQAALQAKGLDRRDIETSIKQLLSPQKELLLLERYINKKKIETDSLEDFDLKQLLYKGGFTKAALQLYFESERE